MCDWKWQFSEGNMLHIGQQKTKPHPQGMANLDNDIVM